jgi:uncharacterized protein (TIGR02588 family)
MKIPAKNQFEWSVFAVSAVLISVVIGTLVHFELTRPDSPPDLIVRTAATRQSAAGYAVAIEVENRGGETAANARIEVELAGSGSGFERGELILPYVPRGGVRTGEVVFSRNPAGGTLRARIVGYERP